ncbi:MAG: adenosylcobinamide-GDP ribazoletransferase [Pseudomonadota bacterium]
MRDEGASFLLAIQFLTRVPVGSDRLYTPKRLAASVRYYPLVGVLIGCVSAAMFLASSLVVPQTVAILLAIATGLLVTGAFHEDGLADTFDGVGGGLTREKALEIMKDSRLGTYGTLALVTALALKASAFVAMSPSLIPAALVAGHGLSRVSSILVIATSRYVRDEGTGKPVAGGLSPISLVVALLTGGVIIAGWTVLQTPFALALALGGLLLGHLLMRLFFEPKLGGYTGDTLGAVQQASEVGFYLGLLIWL